MSLRTAGEAGTAGTVAEALSAASDALSAAGADSPRLDAELLLAAATGAERGQLIADPAAGVAAREARIFGGYVRRRVAREPVAYILGRKGFRGIELEVDRRVLIPRPETELLVEVTLELAPRSVLDVGTGSGAIVLALADELSGAELTATDVSLDALAVAKANADRLGPAAPVRFEHGSLPASGSFELVLANLPYVSEAQWAALQPEIRDYEPRGALVSGPSGFEAIETLLEGLATAGPGSDAVADVVALEVGAGQAPRVAELVRRSGFERVETRRDLAGIDRVVLGRR